MNAGTLNEKIEIWEPQITKTQFGDTKTEYVWFYTTRANVKYNTGSRINDNNEIFYNVTKTFIVRSYVPIREMMKIKYQDKFYRIISIEQNKLFQNKIIITELEND